LKPKNIFLNIFVAQILSEKTTMMSNKILREIVYGGHLLALSASSITFTSIFLLNLKMNFELIAAAYLFTYATYALNRRVEEP
jgi:hypothetical protein